MPKNDAEEARLMAAFDKGALKSVATQAELVKFNAAARATAWKDKPGNPRTLAVTQAALARKASKVSLDDL